MLEFDISLTRPQFRLNANATLPGKGITAIYGASGSGKSTLLNCIAGFEKPDAGSTIILNGRHLLSSDGSSLPIHRRGIGYVTQQSSLFPHLTVGQNLDFAIARRFNELAIDKKDLSDNMGLKHYLGKMPYELSGGERQRVAICRALLSSPYILLLDEPLNALDNAAREDILGHLERLHETIAIPMLYVTHSGEELMRLSDHVITLSEGKVTTQNTTANVLSSLSTPLGNKQDTGVIIEGQIKEFDEQYKLCKIDLNNSVHLWAAGEPASLDDKVRVRIYARDVSITLDKASDSSILNIIPATVCDVLQSGHGQCLVELDCSAHKLLARLTNKSVDELEICKGKPVYAQVKGVALLGVARQNL